MQGTLLLAHIAGDAFLGTEAAEHAERQDGDDHQQYETGDQSHAALRGVRGRGGFHITTPARPMTWMTRSIVMYWGWLPPATYIGLSKLRTTRTALTVR